MRRRAYVLVTASAAALAIVTTALATVLASPAAAVGGFVGNVELVSSPVPGQVYVGGWVFDDDVPTSPISVHVYVGGAGPGDPSSYGRDIGLAQSGRNDVGASYPYAGPNHGYGVAFDVPMHGTHPVYIFAINAPGTAGANALLWSGTVTIADAPPQTVITAGPPAQGTAAGVTLEFGTSEPGTFSCRWDQGAWQSCTSPVTTTVAPGAHTFAVYATNLAGTSDPSPATYAFTVAVPPTPPPVVVPPPGQPRIALGLKAVKKKSRLRIDVGPDLEQSNYRMTVQRKAGRKWRTVRITQTLGPQDVVVLDLRRGKYRVVVPAQHGLAGVRATARLRR